MIADVETYQRLVKHYREQSDETLIALLEHIDGLTSSAQEILRSEISIRRLNLPSVATDLKHLDTNAPEPEELGRFAERAIADCLWEFAETEDAQAAAEMLSDADIDYDLLLPRSDTLDMRAPRIAVHPDDVIRARELLSRPIPEEFRILVRTRDEFIVPVCPRCHATDPLLESIEPTNKWLCEACNHTWIDSPNR